MGTPKMFISTTHFDLFNKRSVNEFLFTKMFLFVTSFWFSATGYVFYLIGLISIYIFRFKTNNTSESHDKSCTTVGVTDREAILPQEDGPIVASSCLEPERESEITIFEDSDHDDGFPQEEEPKFCFKFQFHTSEDTPTGYRESEDSINPSKAPTVNTSKYQFSSGKDFCGFVEEPEVVSFAVKDLYADSNYDSFSDNEIIQGGFLSEKIQQLYSKAQVVYEESVGNYSPVDLSKEESGKTKSEPLTEAQVAEKEEQVSPETDLPGKEDISYEVQFLFEKDFVALDSEPESISLSDVFSLKDHAFDSNSDEFLSERDFGEGLDTGTQIYFDGEKVKLAEETQGYEEPHLQNSSFLDRAIEISDGSFSVWKPIKQISNSIDNEIELREKIRNSEEPSFQKSSNLVHAEVLSDEDFSDDEDIPDPEVIYGSQEKETMDGLERSEQPNLQDSSVPELDDTNRLEILWEHQDLIEQLRMELRKVRATGLPTILEEDESPKMMEDLKPWKIDEKYLHEDRMDELHRFYKSYRERMRKFDILNYQKMYGIGFLQLKDPLQSISSRRSSTPAIASVLFHNLRLFKRGRVEADPTMKFARELQRDLEMVYVGQVCLSWEILNWQYNKAQELQETDPDGLRRYNQVAGEFQQFQVLIQRFLENETFEGPRVQNYVKNRCVLRNLLQLPVIKEDSVKNKTKGKRKRRENDVITSTMLTQIIEKSMQIFWDFLRADKDETNVILKGFLGTQVELQNSADSQLLMDVRTNLQKKEKRLKDLLRSGNCIVKRLQKHHQEGKFDQTMFCSQVDMKLMSRVLNMSAITTDQLLWCQKKLNKISFVGRKIQREPSILLFPC